MEQSENFENKSESDIQSENDGNQSESDMYLPVDLSISTDKASSL